MSEFIVKLTDGAISSIFTFLSVLCFAASIFYIVKAIDASAKERHEKEEKEKAAHTDNSNKPKNNSIT